MNILGLHHVSAITANAEKNYHFYTKVLGLRLVKKTVNQDDINVYHLFYGDEAGSPGTELTFFEIPNAARTHEGNNSISEISLRVSNDAALEYWKERLAMYQVEQEEITERFNRKVLPFRDPEGQRLLLVSDEHNQGVAGGKPWGKSPVPKEYAIIGLGPVKLTVPIINPTAEVLTSVLGFRKAGEYAALVAGQGRIEVYESGEGGTGSEIHIEKRNDLPAERLGRGGVHHVAFRVRNTEELESWIEKLNYNRHPNTGLVDRHYFQAAYFKEPNGILFELATDGPGFATDEDIEHLGERLSLPPFLEEKREQIEANLKPIHTKQ